MNSSTNSNERVSDQQDLSPILRNLMRRGGRSTKSREARRRLANDKLTRAYLDAGLRLIIEQLENRSDLQREEQDEEISPFFRWLARQGVLAEAERIADNVVPSEGTFRHRWEFQADYIYDLLAYSLYCQGWSGPSVLSLPAAERISSSENFADAIHWITYRDMCNLMENPSYRLALMASAATAQQSEATKATSNMYRLRGEARKRFLQYIIDSRGTRLRSDVRVQEVSDILQALLDGMCMRQAADPEIDIVDHQQRQSLFGKAALAVIAGTTDNGDGLSLEEFVNTIANPKLRQ